MYASNKLRLFAMVVSSALTIATTSAMAQSSVADRVVERLVTAADQIQAACAEDANKFCSSVTPGEGRLLFCMIAHEDQIATKCNYALYRAGRALDRALNRLEYVADACWNDIEQHCPEAAAGEGRIATCLISKKASLSKECSDVVAAIGK